MYLGIAGQDRSADTGADLARRAARHRGPLSRWSEADSALSLREARDTQDFLERYCRLVRLHTAASVADFPIPGRPGAAGTLLRQLKAFLWKLLRYQHERMAGQQNAINGLVAHAVDLQRAASREALAALEQRVQVLEAKLARSRTPTNNAHSGPESPAS